MSEQENITDGLIRSGCGLLIGLFYLLVGGWSVNYLLDFFLEESISFAGAVLLGLIVGEVSIPVAATVVILKWFGVL